MKAAIFYFTMSGNTELAAKEVAEATGAPLVRLHAYHHQSSKQHF